MEKVIKALKESGWYEGRCIDISIYENHFEKLGLQLHDAARKFFSEYGLLEIDIDCIYIDRTEDQHFLSNPAFMKLINEDRIRRITTNPEYFEDSIHLINAYSQHFNEIFIPAYLKNDQWPAFITENNRFYLCGDYMGYCNGTDFKQIIYNEMNSIINDENTEEITELL